MSALLQRELIVITAAYFLAGIPVGALMLASRLSPLYQLPKGFLCRWWSRFALVIVALAVAMSAAGFTGQ